MQISPCGIAQFYSGRVVIYLLVGASQADRDDSGLAEAELVTIVVGADGNAAHCFARGNGDGRAHTVAHIPPRAVVIGWAHHHIKTVLSRRATIEAKLGQIFPQTTQGQCLLVARQDVVQGVILPIGKFPIQNHWLLVFGRARQHHLKQFVGLQAQGEVIFGVTAAVIARVACPGRNSGGCIKVAAICASVAIVLGSNRGRDNKGHIGCGV